MKPKLQFNIGDKYGRLTIVKEVQLNKSRQRMVLCRCDCGRESERNLRSLLLGVVQRFCGCLIKKTKAQLDHDYWFRKKSKRPIKIIKDLPNEEWREVCGYEGLYLVSNMGRVKGVERTNKKRGIIYECPEKLLSATGGNPYKQVRLFNGGVGVSVSVHRLVAMAFIPNPENKPEVNHKLGNKHDNRASELEWATKSENEIHSVEVLGRQGVRGEKNHNCKLTSKQVNEIRSKYKRRVYTANMLANEYGISQPHAIMIINGKNRKYG